LSYPNKFTVVDYENAQNVLTYWEPFAELSILSSKY
jgi:hypothetical protein